ncbi:PP2C family protein-serine/threonine phosphatase, partial [Rhodohalobacter sp.]
PQPSVKTAKLFKGNRLILCSDGLNGMLSDEQIQSILEEGEPIDETCGKLVKSANEAGGEDNITCLMVEIHEGPKPSSEDLLAQTQVESKTTTTQVLRKKNSNKNLAIAALFFVITVLAAWIYFDGSSPEVNAVPSTTPEEPPTQEIPDDSLENSYQPANMEEENSAEPAEEEPPAELPDEPTADPVPDLPEDSNSPDNADKPTEKPKESEKDSVKQQAKPVDKDSTVTVSPKDLESKKDTVSVAPVVSDSTETSDKSLADSVAIDGEK